MGSLDIRGRFKAENFEVQGTFVEMSTATHSVTAVLRLALDGELTDTLAEERVPVFNMSPADVSIPGVLIVMSIFSVSLRTEITKLGTSV